MTVNRDQIRKLLIPACYQWAGDRGVPFEDSEIEAVVDAYFRGGIQAAYAVGLRLAALPLMLRVQQSNLKPLRSVSAAYKAAQIPAHFRTPQEDTNAHWKSTQKAPRHTPQASSANYYGTPPTSANTIISGSGTVGSTGTYYDPWRDQQQLNNAALQQQNAFYATQQGIFHGSGVFSNNLTMPGGIIQYLPHNYVSAEPPKPLPVEVKAGEITAWRAWAVNPNGALISTALGTEWTPGKPMEGVVKSHGSEGVHAWKSRYDAERYIQDHSSTELVLGEVELWGKVIEHDTGYRAEFAAIKGITWTTSAQFTAAQLRELYQLPAVENEEPAPILPATHHIHSSVGIHSSTTTLVIANTTSLGGNFVFGIAMGILAWTFLSKVILSQPIATTIIGAAFVIASGLIGYACCKQGPR